MKINLSPRFKRSYKKLPIKIQDDFDKKIVFFAKDTRDPKLDSHKLNGKLQACLSFYLKDGYRVLFEFRARDELDLLDVGPHDKYRAWRK